MPAYLTILEVNCLRIAMHEVCSAPLLEIIIIHKSELCSGMVR